MPISEGFSPQRFEGMVHRQEVAQVSNPRKFSPSKVTILVVCVYVLVIIDITMQYEALSCH